MLLSTSANSVGSTKKPFGKAGRATAAENEAGAFLLPLGDVTQHAIGAAWH